ncbi:Heavy metal-associated domain, HMA [Sesbania bispinosa]|nr:Heavy metal-associated domain, HMA [Sesbania bispinosa]
MQTPRVTQIQVRVDCNGCVQKIKKALNGIDGIHDLRVDLHRQKLTIIGWADPEKVVKAIKKTRKNAIICSNIELPSPSRPTEPEPKGNGSAPDAAQPPPAEAPPAQASPPPEPPHEATPSPTPTQHNARQQWQNNPGRKGAGQVHMMQHHRPNYINKFSSGQSYVDHRDRYHDSPVFLQEPSQPMYVTHSYDTHMPSSYVTEYEYVSSESWHTHYNSREHYSEAYQNGNVNIRSMFSDDNPNACSIV